MQSKATYDAIIIGGGHNGLTAAAYLAKARLKVLVLERRGVLGGAAASEAIFPGYTVNTGALDSGLFLPEVVADLRLEKHGVRFLHSPAVLHALQAARAVSERIALFGYQAVRAELEEVKALLNVQVEQVQYSTPEDTEAGIRALAGRGFKVVVGSSMVCRLAREAGMRKAVVFSSYFLECDKRWPELRLSEVHPYIRSRVEQTRAEVDARRVDVPAARHRSRGLGGDGAGTRPGDPGHERGVRAQDARGQHEGAREPHAGQLHRKVGDGELRERRQFRGVSERQERPQRDLYRQRDRAGQCGGQQPAGGPERRVQHPAEHPARSGSPRRPE